MSVGAHDWILTTFNFHASRLKLVLVSTSKSHLHVNKLNKAFNIFKHSLSHSAARLPTQKLGDTYSMQNISSMEKVLRSEFHKRYIRAAFTAC